MTIEPVVWVAAIGAVTSVVVSLLNRKEVESLHTLINSNLTKQIEASVAEGFGRGIAIGIEQERQRKERLEENGKGQ